MKITRSVIAVSVFFWLATGNAAAEFIGLDLSSSNWATNRASSVNQIYSESIDLVDDLDVDNPKPTSMVFILEHPIAALPNIRYQGYELDSSGTKNLDSNLYFIGESFNTDNRVTSSFDLSQNDIVLYYQLLNNWIDLDLGVDLKRFDGEVSFADATNTSVSIDETIPLLHLSARFNLPYNGFYVGADINAHIIDLGLSESSAQDSTILLGYDSGKGLGVEGGFKYFSLDLDDIDQQNTNLEYDGIFLNGYFNF